MLELIQMFGPLIFVILVYLLSRVMIKLYRYF